MQKQQISLIPVVFITNESLMKIDSAGCINLAKNIVATIGEMILNNRLQKTNELQLDCDWTVSSSKNYFILLREVKRLINTSKKTFHEKSLLSATIRLHQVKFRNKTGIPPADKGLLMCYNMGNLKNKATKNSILDADELKKYTAGLNSYPLQLDIALPLFSWHVLFRNSNFKGIIGNTSNTSFNSDIGTWQQNRFVFSKDTVIKNIQFYSNDELRYEECTQTELLNAATYIASMKNAAANHTVLFYHLDESLLKKYSHNELEKLFRCFH
ncbi:MAG: hypothetical protein QM725_16865 [Lacibacter sp.]